MPNDTTVACYYFPNYHVDTRNESFHGRGWTEWELVKKAVPRFPGHEQPKQPLWGYTDEADPQAMAQKIAAAADHGIDTFIFDWYYYNDGPFLQRALQDGFLQSANNGRVKFALMWANHDWVDIHPAGFKATPRLLYPGAVTPETFERMTDYILEAYFNHPSYWKIEGCPYFSVYELFRLVESFGSLDAAKRALQRFREKARAAGFADLHLNAVTWGVQILPNEKQVSDPADLIEYLGFHSTTSYVWIHHVPLRDFPTTDYDYVMEKYFQYAPQAEHMFSCCYHPNVTMGWDSSPRTVPDAPFENTGYPYMASMAGNTPQRFQKALEEVKLLLVKRPPHERIITINCWNEWTEGSYLEPDTTHGTAYLEAVRSTFT